MPKKYFTAVGITLIILILGFILKSTFINPKSPSVAPTPTPSPISSAQQLSEDKYPKASLTFSNDARYVTVDITDVYADQLEYNIIYYATVKKNRIQTGVNAAAKLEGKTDYSQKQLLGSESNGKFTYHENIQNAVMELTLRDSENRSIFTATYPFEVSPGDTVTLSNPQ